jgi:hypothetical protein
VTLVKGEFRGPSIQVSPSLRGGMPSVEGAEGLLEGGEALRAPLRWRVNRGVGREIDPRRHGRGPRPDFSFWGQVQVNSMPLTAGRLSDRSGR